MPHLLELFSGTKSIGKVFEAAGWTVTSVDLRADFQPTIVCDALELQPAQIEGRVDVVWASPPCTDYSRARTTAKTPRNLELSDKLVQVGIDMAKHFGAPLWCENPLSMLQHREVVRDLRMHLIDYCRYGESDYPDAWHALYRKRTMIFCSGHDWSPSRPLCRKDCLGCPDGRKHTEQAQRIKTAGARGNRLEELYAIPPALPRELLAWWNSKRAHLLHLLETRHWRAKTNRMNIAHKKRYVPCVSATGKKYLDRRVLEPQQSECLSSGEVWEFVRSMLPPWFIPGEWFCVTVNRNVTCAKHRDKGNIGSVGLMFLGNFEGGALLTENGDRFEERGVWHRYEGAEVAHWNEPITAGTKYAVVVHNNKRQPLVFPVRKKTDETPPERTGDGL